MIAAISLFLIVSLSVLITKVAAIALVHTGLSTDSAKFQARSAYTGTGFSSKEAESVMNHPLRRKIIYNLMLVGNAGIVTVMSSLILTFVLPNTMASKLYGLLIIVVGMLLLWWAIKSKWVDRRLSRIMDKLLKKYTNLDIHDFAAVLHFKDDYKIGEIPVDVDGWLGHKTLQELDLRKEGISVLGVDRMGNEYFGSPTGNFEILPRDVLTVYGKADGIKSLYKRKKDFYAEREHQKFVEKENDRKEQEKEKIDSVTEN